MKYGQTIWAVPSGRRVAQANGLNLGRLSPKVEQAARSVGEPHELWSATRRRRRRRYGKYELADGSMAAGWLARPATGRQAMGPEGLRRVCVSERTSLADIQEKR